MELHACDPRPEPPLPAHFVTLRRAQKSLTRALLTWYRANARPLPWRNTHDPYRIWVSEIMLQQTRVETVLPYYRRFLKAFPTVRRLAALATAHDLTYTVHLPLDLRHDPAGQHPSLQLAARVIDLTARLAPHAYVFHLDGSDVAAPGWLDQASCALEELCTLVEDPQRLALENLENYAPEHLLPLYAAFPIRRTLDIGHLWKMGRDPLPLLDDWLPAASVVHLHGMATIDHQSLAVMPPVQLDPIVRALLDWHGVLTLEVFEDDFFTSHAALLAAIERVQT